MAASTTSSPSAAPAAAADTNAQSIGVCSRAVCWCSYHGVDFANLWRWAWSDDDKASAYYNLLFRLPLGLYFLCFCLYYTVANLDTNVGPDAQPERHFWYLSNWGLYFTGAYITGAGIIGAVQFGGALFSSEPVTEPGRPAGTQGASPPPVSEATPIVPDTTASEAAPSSGAAKSHGAQALPLAPVDAAPGSCPDVNDVCDCTTVTQLNTLAQGGAQVPISCSPQSALWVQQTLVFLFHLAAGLGVGITLIYWLLLFNYSSPPEGAGLYRSVQTHISILVPVLEMAMGRVPVLSSHFPAFLLVCLLYLIVNGAFTAANPGESLYSILTWTRGTDAVVAIGVLLLVIVAYWSAFSLTRIRDFMARAWRGEAPASAGTLLAAPSSKVEPAQAGAEAEAASGAEAANQV